MAVQFFLLLTSSFVYLAICGPCLTNGIQGQSELDGCRLYGDDYNVDFNGVNNGGSSLGYIAGSSISDTKLEYICSSSRSFCFPSTLSGFSYEEHMSGTISSESSSRQCDDFSSIGSPHGSRAVSNNSWSSDCGIFELSNDRTVACSLSTREHVNELLSFQMARTSGNNHSPCRSPLLPQKSAIFTLDTDSEMMNSSPIHISSPYVKVSPSILDWGQKHLFFPSVAFLTVINACNDSILHVYEPFSTNVQFYPCNFSEVTLGPGEVVSICFVFLPRWLGLSSGQLILQTSSGGFFVQTKGYAIGCPYGISPLINLDGLSGRWLSRNFTLSNPYNETLYVKEVSAWMSVSQKNISHLIAATCNLQSTEDFERFSWLSVNDRLVVYGGKTGFRHMALRPHANWEIGPDSSRSIIEVDMSFEYEGFISGAICVDIVRSSQGMSDIIMIPVEIYLVGNVAEVGGNVDSPIVISFEVLSTSFDRKVIVVSMKNGSPHILRIVRIIEVPRQNFFQIKYSEGLLLFPGTVTQVALLTCSKLFHEFHISSKVSKVNENCSLVLLTNDSVTPQIEVPCMDMIHVCLEHQKVSSVKFSRHSLKAKFDKELPMKMKGLEMAEVEGEVLENWKSLGTSSSLSVLSDHELVFPVVRVGSYQAKWIIVSNPSQQPVLMQLILSSGEIIDNCIDTDTFLQSVSSNRLVSNGSPTIYGFSMAENALTEAYVHPCENASFGPILFHPSNRCGWRGSALVRNNLSGLESILLRGFGGSLSLALLAGSELVDSIEFSFSMTVPLNVSPQNMFFHMEETTYNCFQPLFKVLYVKNVGDLPLDVKSIEVSGRECGLDGFMVHTCEGFSLEPGESIEFLISYQCDFSAPVVHRDLQLAYSGGILVIPMKASLPSYMFNLCKKSIFWMRLRKFSVVVLLAAFLIFVIFFHAFPQLVAIGSCDYLCKSVKQFITSEPSVGKSSRTKQNQRLGNHSMPHEDDGLFSSDGKGKTVVKAAVDTYPIQNGALKDAIIVQKVMSPSENDKRINILSYDKADKVVPVGPSKSASVECCDTLETSSHCNLRIKIGKEKGKRRRRRRGINAGLTGLNEVSSSQSGSSTPPSPLSPLISLTPSRLRSPSLDMDPMEARNSFIKETNRQLKKIQFSEVTCRPAGLVSNDSSIISAMQQPQSELERATFTPGLLPSLAFPSGGGVASSPTCSSSMALTSVVKPRDRAPGPKPFNQKTVNVGENVGDKYRYDIWGNHFPGLLLMDRPMTVATSPTSMKSVGTENDSGSFFVRGPQAFVTESHPKPMSCLREEG